MIYTKLKKIADISRANNGSIYPAYTSYIELSATRGYIGMIAESGKISSRNAIIHPKININPVYFNLVLQNALPRFISKYLTTINLQKDLLGEMEIAYEENEKEQLKVVNLVNIIKREEELTAKAIDKANELKQVLLNKMII